jgi:hypothetical protein
LGDDVGEVDVGAAPHAREQPVELAAAHQTRRDQHGPDPRPLRAATAAAPSACSRLIRPLGLQHLPQPFHGDQDLDARPGAHPVPRESTPACDARPPTVKLGPVARLRVVAPAALAQSVRATHS